MTALEYKQNAVRHLFKYLDVRPGKLTIIYEEEYRHIIDAISHYLQVNKLNYSASIYCSKDLSKKEIYKILTESEKFLCAFNPHWQKGFKSKMEIMSELSTSLSHKAYTLSDMSGAFFNIFQACPDIINALNTRLIRCLQTGKSLRVTDTNGTDIKITLDESYDWVNMDGFAEADFDLTCNLPVGEVATYSPKVEGEIYFTGALLGTIPIGRNHGLIKDPIYFRIKDNAVTEIKTGDKKLLEDLEICLYYDEYTHFVNEVAVGTNYGIPTPLNGLNYKYEENQFGFHIGFGASLAQQNVERLTPHHLDLVFNDSIVYLDDQLLYKDEMYHLENFPVAELDLPLRLAKRTCCIP